MYRQYRGNKSFHIKIDRARGAQFTQILYSSDFHIPATDFQFSPLKEMKQHSKLKLRHFLSVADNPTMNVVSSAVYTTPSPAVAS